MKYFEHSGLPLHTLVSTPPPSLFSENTDALSLSTAPDTASSSAADCEVIITVYIYHPIKVGIIILEVIIIMISAIFFFFFSLEAA